MDQGAPTPGYVKLLLPPRQSRGNSHFGLAPMASALPELRAVIWRRSSLAKPTRPFKNGLPDYVKLQNAAVPKKLTREFAI